MGIVDPYELPDALPLYLPKVLNYWRELRRGQADIPFADDIRRTALPEHEDDLILIDAFSKPIRFRFGLVGASITAAYGSEVAGMFLDDFAPNPPLNLILSQASAAAELRKANFYRTEDYARLILPAWADGHVSALLCAIAVVE